MKRGVLPVVLMCLVGGIAGCSSLPWAEQDAQLYSPVYGGVGVGVVGMAADDLLSEGGIPLCLDAPGSVTITAVEAVEPSNGLSVVDFAVRYIPLGDVPQGDGLGDLSTLGLTQAEKSQRAVTNVCDEQSRANVGLDGPPPEGTQPERVELAVTVTAPAVPASTKALLIRYTDASGDERTTTSAFAIAMCPGQAGDSCDPL